VVRKELYTALRDRIKAAMPWVRWIDLQKGQADAPSKTFPLPLPCVLIEIKPVTWETYSDNSQLGQATVSLTLIQDHSGNTVHGADSETESLKMLDRMDDVFQAIQDLSGNHFKRLVRMGDEVTRYKLRTVESRTDFTTTLVDTLEELKAQLPAAEFTVELEVQ